MATLQRRVDLGLQRKVDLGLQRKVDLGLQRRVDLGLQRRPTKCGRLGLWNEARQMQDLLGTVLTSVD